MALSIFQTMEKVSAYSLLLSEREAFTDTHMDRTGVDIYAPGKGIQLKDQYEVLIDIPPLDGTSFCMCFTV